MERVVWDEKYKIGVEAVDKAHAKLFRIMGKLLDISGTPEGNQHTYREALKYLETYCMSHFFEEEAYMRSIRYRGYAQHKKIHDNFRDKTLVSLKRDLELSGYSAAAVQRFAVTLNRWLIEHIMREDQAIVGKNVGQRGQDLTSQINILSKAVNRASQELFQTEAELVSAEYKGENIGKSFYCQHTYDVEDGIRLQMLLGAEEALILRGVNRDLGSNSISKEEVTGDEALAVFYQLYQSLGKVFQVESEHKFNKDNLLDRDRFRAEFMKGYPCSLLFSTRSGFLILSYRSWRVKEAKSDRVPEKESPKGLKRFGSRF